MAKPAAKKPETAKRETLIIKGEAALKEFSPGRWATIFKVDDNDPREEVIDIKQMAPGTVPGLFGLEDSENADKYSIEQVPADVIIGMRRGGKFEAVQGFGWRDAEDKAVRGNPIGQGAARLADVGAE